MDDDTDQRLRPTECSVRDGFVLMMHDRLLELEREVRALRPRPVDPRVRLLSSASVSDTGAVFLRVRVRDREPLDLDRWAEGLLRAVPNASKRRVDAWCCQHWSFVGANVVEALVQYSGEPAVDVGQVAHATLDAWPCATERVEACAVSCPAWFAESIRAAAGSTTAGARLHTWDPEAEAVVVTAAADGDEVHNATPGESMIWALLHGWLACHAERAEVWHPRALCSSKMATDLVSTLGRLLAAAE